MEEFTLILKPIVPELRVRVVQDEFGEYQAMIIPYPGCIGDGATRDEAIGAAVSVYLHMLIRRINSGAWMPQVKRPF